MKIKHNTRKNIISFFAVISIMVLCLISIAPLISADNYWPSQSGMTKDISFSGHYWWVGDWNTYNPNYVSVDANGWLHLKQHANSDSCVFTYDVEGYGTYSYVLANGIQYIDKNAVIGMFAYRSNLTSSQEWQESDIEQSKWGNEQGTNFDFVVQPNSANQKNYFTMPYGSSDTTFVIDWEHNFQQYFILDTASGNVLKSWNVTATRDATGVFGCIDIWHYLSATTLDTNIIIKSYSYQANTIYHAPNTLPVINSNPVTSAIQTEPYTYQVNCTNSPTYILTVKPTGMTISSGGLISWPSPTYGTIPVTIKATNAYGTVYQTFNIIVQATPQKPIFSSTPITTAINGQQYQYQTSVSPAITSYSVSGINGISIDQNGVISVVPSTIGVFPIVLKATNNDGSSWQNYSLTVSNPAINNTVIVGSVNNIVNNPFVPNYGTYSDMSNQAGAIGTVAFAIFAVVIIPAIVYRAIKKR